MQASLDLQFCLCVLTSCGRGDPCGGGAIVCKTYGPQRDSSALAFVVARSGKLFATDDVMSRVR